MGFSNFWLEFIGLFPVLIQPFINIVCLMFVAFTIINLLLALVKVLADLKGLVWPF